MENCQYSFLQRSIPKMLIENLKHNLPTEVSINMAQKNKILGKILTGDNKKNWFLYNLQTNKALSQIQKVYYNNIFTRYFFHIQHHSIFTFPKPTKFFCGGAISLRWQAESSCKQLFWGSRSNGLPQLGKVLEHHWTKSLSL